MGTDNPTDPAAGSPSDDELLAAVRQGDTAALETLLVRYQPHLYRFGLRMCGNVEDAGDVAQESLISMARSVGDFRGDSSVSSWLHTIARRFCIRKRRRSKFAPARDESLDVPGTGANRHLVDPGPTPEQAATNQELAIALAHAIDGLQPSQREVLVLRDVEGLSAPEVARIMGMRVDAVKSRLHRARVAVRDSTNADNHWTNPALYGRAGGRGETVEAARERARFAKTLENGGGARSRCETAWLPCDSLRAL